MRQSGILLHISSLPSKYGIGTFGKEAYEFVDFLKKSGQTLWQVLPLGPTSFGDSPYQTFCAFSMNPYFIDLDILVSEKLLKKVELPKNEQKHTIDYEWLYLTRFNILRHAFNRFNLQDPSFMAFTKTNRFWLKDYALFMAIKRFKNGESWQTWEEDIRMRRPEAIKTYETRLKNDIFFEMFIQFQAFKQWSNLKRYANENGVQMIGDIPIYVALDSSDVWANPRYFKLDEQKRPTHVAGVPPDNFSTDGQLWGNPLYDWEYHRINRYQFWKRRMKMQALLYDVVRIDHFIGFVNYYSIPYQDTTAKNGQWLKGPGYDLFKHLKQELENVQIIAEDLGAITQEVRDLLKILNFPGMKLLQFAFDPNEESSYIPHLYEKNSVAYTGTHDNPTSKTWFENLDIATKEYCYDYINHRGANPVFSLIKETLKSQSNIAIIPLQDYLNLGDEARMNTPSTLGKNWLWRFDKKFLNEKLAKKILSITTIYGRNKE